MADFREVGIGIASALASEHGPNPFPLAFKGQSLPEAGRIVTAILDECAGAGIRLERVELDPDLYEYLHGRVTADQRIVSNASLQGEVRIFRPAN